jgi:uncharacterized protein YecE (DUF72 family)
VEFRHRSWFDDGRWPETEELLRELDITYVGVDAPQLGSGTAPPHLAITSRKLSIVRFHGRNYKTWYKKVEKTGERFDYLYSPKELKQWVPAIRAAADQGVPVHVLFNNNRSNYAVVNAFDMAHLLDITTPRPPAAIIERIRERDGDVPGWIAQLPEPEPMALEDASDKAPRSRRATGDDQLTLDV